MPTVISATNQTPRAELELGPRIQEYGEKIFALIDAAESPSLFSKKGFYGTLMDWAMRDEHFKTQLFRFVDVLPMLTSSSEIARHLDLMDLLGREIARWHHPCKSNDSPRGPVPPLNVSVKISALYSQIHPTDPDTAIDRISARLFFILQRAKVLCAFINFDMESY